MDLYDQCQKTLVVDEKMDRACEGWHVVEVPRVDTEFSWANMWDAGVASSRFDTVLYLDSDRLLPRSYLGQVVNNMHDGVFVFTSRHFQMLKEASLENCWDFLERASDEMMNADLLGALRFEQRYQNPLHGPGKNVMSGNTAFTKRTYMELGGVDHWYRGHGAYADTDFHFWAALQGCKFVDLELPELHCPHKKELNGGSLDEMTLRRLGLDNFIYYCWKWDLPMALAENLSVDCGIQSPARYVDKRLEVLGLESK